MRRSAAILLVISMMLALCGWGPAAADPRQKYAVEENTAENKAVYPYIVRTESATWYLSADDIALLGEEAFFDGLYETLRYQEEDFADARSALAGFIPEEVESIDIYTDFCGKAGASEVGGAYYNEDRNFIKVFRGWQITQFTLLHEYVHYLTVHCAENPVTHGLFAEGIADYVSKILCRNRMMRCCSRFVSEEEKAFLKAHGAWDGEEDCVDPLLYWFGRAESFALGQAMGEEYMCTADIRIIRTEEIQRNPAADTISHMEAACIMAYLAEKYSREELFSHMGMDPADLEQVFGEAFPELYRHWTEWNAVRCAELGLAM